MEGIHFFTEDMVAPCGLDCSLCGEALKETHPCAGCMGPDENKPAFCSKHCTIITCENLVKSRYRFCTECPDYPCAHNSEREARYMSQYVMRESPLTNLTDILELGMGVFLSNQARRWTCKTCGDGIVCVHTGVCSNCGRQHCAADIAD